MRYLDRAIDTLAMLTIVNAVLFVLFVLEVMWAN
jgi:hypothetical protein